MKFKTPIWFYNEIYMENFYFCPSFTDEEYREAIYEITGLDWSGSKFSNARTTEISMDSGRYYIFIQLKDIEDIPSLAHECFHASNYIMNRKGIRPDADNDEAQAYLIEWIFKNCYSHLPPRIN